ncbi:MAG: hypothetical protein L0Z48_01660 [candidate division Zixibacteria bacterium]|nr:hypothetical protein [candidate division Zixibacteria bacterium]MCI0595229.1 hypothetical protein [candidate division Zixibacteria bacterium]
MKKICFGFAFFAFVWMAAAPSVAKDRPKTGVLAKNSLTDSAFGYATSFPPLWKSKVKEEPSLIRLTLEKSDVQINPRFSLERSNAGTRPRFLILADTTSHILDDFVKLVFGDRPWKRRGEYLKALDWRPLDEELDRRRVMVAGQPGMQISFARDMTAYFAETGGTAPGMEFRAEVITVFKKGDRIYTTVLFSSKFFLESNFKDVMPVFTDWKFLEASPPGEPAPADN